MSVEQIRSLLHQSTQLFARRNISEAIASAEKALALAGQKEDHPGLIHSHLLLGKCHSTAARYSGNPQHWEQALQHLKEAQQLNQQPRQNGHTIDILLALGEVYQNDTQYDEAESYYTQAKGYSDQKEDHRGMILSLCAASQLAILRSDYQKAQSLAEASVDKIEASPAEFHYLAIESYHLLTQICVKRQDYGGVLEYCEPLLELSRVQGDVEKELDALNYLAVYYGTLSDYKRAMQHLLEALDKSKAIHYRNVTARCLINIATIYAHFYNYEEALSRNLTALSEYGDIIEDNNRAIVLNNVGNVYYKLDQYEQAEVYFQQSLEVAASVQYREMMALSMAQISRSKTALGEIDKALALANEAQILIQELGDVSGREINLLNLGNIHYLQKDYDQAIILTSQGIVAAKRRNDEANEIRGYQLLSKIHQQLGDFEKALQFQLVYSTAQELFAKERLNRQVMDLEVQYSIKEKQNKIEQLTKENQLQALLLEQKDQIVKQNAQLLQANEELRQFAYVASHDLKEPLRMIGSYTQLIYRRHGNDFDSDSASYFDFVSEGVNRMNNLLDALLRYATIGKTDEEFEEVRLNDAIELSVINLRVSIEETGAEIQIPQLPVVRSIQSLLIQLFQNLISNAIKFRKPGSNPVVTIGAEEAEDEIIVSVKDNGIGIAPEYQERIFVIFQRLHTRVRYEGAGIGLSICLKIMQRLGGRIWIESEVGEGATFLIALPKVPDPV